jgi:hypothetical protein
MLVAAILVPLMLVACADADPGGPASPPPPADGGDGSGPVPGQLFAEIVGDAAARTEVEPGAIEVVSAEAVTWSDGSLGCPEPGGMYTQALVPGYRLVLSAGDETLDYHADQGGNFVLCPPDRARDPIEDGGGSS